MIPLPFFRLFFVLLFVPYVEGRTTFRSSCILVVSPRMYLLRIYCTIQFPVRFYRKSRLTLGSTLETQVRAFLLRGLLE
jgi:hypothetical protein